jgi:hypothetical protein
MPKSRGRAGRAHRRYIAKIRHDTNTLRRRARYSIAQGGQVYAILLAVLAQSGGEITVTQGTLNQVGANMQQLGYIVTKGTVENEFIVRLVEGKQPPEAPAVGPDVATVQGTPEADIAHNPSGQHDA